MGLPRPEIEVEVVLHLLRSAGLLGSIADRCGRCGCGCWLFFSREVCDEGWSPGLAAVVRIRFFVAMRILRDVRPHSSNEDGFVVEGVLREEFAASILEGADQRRRQRSHLAIDEVLVPLMKLRL
jgi:hypothetical protein